MDARQEIGLLLTQILLVAIQGKASTIQFLQDTKGCNAQPPAKPDMELGPSSSKQLISFCARQPEKQTQQSRNAIDGDNKQ